MTCTNSLKTSPWVPRDARSWRWHAGVAGAFLVAGLAFAFNPKWDLAIAAHFYADGAGFPLETHPQLNWLFFAVDALGRALFVLLSLAWIVLWFRRGASPQHLRRWRVTGFLWLALLLGPGLITHDGFKNHWGRARPRAIEAFGGSAQFSPALTPSQQCAKNCSFVSGHAAMSYFPVVLAFIWRRHTRRYLLLGAATGLAVGWTRVIVGAHFPSDILFAYLTCYLPALAIALVWRTPTLPSTPRSTLGRN